MQKYGLEEIRQFSMIVDIALTQCSLVLNLLEIRSNKNSEAKTNKLQYSMRESNYTCTAYMYYEERLSKMHPN